MFGTAIHVSAEFRARKPDPLAYTRCVAALGARPEDTLFVDDSQANVDGAVQAGLRGHLHSTAEALAAVLA